MFVRGLVLATSAYQALCGLVMLVGLSGTACDGPLAWLAAGPMILAGLVSVLALPERRRELWKLALSFQVHVIVVGALGLSAAAGNGPGLNLVIAALAASGLGNFAAHLIRRTRRDDAYPHALPPAPAAGAAAPVAPLPVAVPRSDPAGWILAAVAVASFCLVGLIGAVLGLVWLGFQQEQAAGYAWPPESAALVRRQRGGAASIESDELNFAIDQIPPVFREVNPRTLNDDAVVALVRSRPEVCFMVIAEDVGIEAGATTEDLAEVARENALAAAPGCRIGRETPRSAHGLDWLSFEVAVPMPEAEDLVYVYTVRAHRGYLYQLVTWGARSDRLRVTGDARAMHRRFRIAEPDRASQLAGGEPLERLESARFGYTLPLPGGGWVRWEDVRDSVDAADAGALRGHDTALLVMPVLLEGRDVPLEALTSGLLARLDLEFPGDAVRVTGPIERDGGHQGYVLEAEQVVDDVRHNWRLHVLRRPDVAYLLGAWASGDDPPVLDQVAPALDMVVLDQVPAARRDAAGLTPAERTAHGLVYNEIGLALYGARQFRPATAWFGRAAELAGSDPVILENAIDAYARVNEFGEALAVLDRHLENDPGREDLLARRAWLLEEAGDPAAALAVYGPLFDAGFRDEEHLERYVELLLEQDRLETAAAVIERYQAGGAALAASLLEARVHARRGDRDTAVASLDELRRERPGNAVVAYALVDALVEAERHQEAVELCRDMIARGWDSAHCRFMKGFAELALGLYRPAKASFESALALEPANEQIRMYLAHVSGMLGEGSNTAIKAPLDPVALPEALSDEGPHDTRASADHGGAVYAHRSTAIRFEPGERLTTTERYVVDLLDAAGVSRFSAFSLGFDPLAEQIHVNELLVSDGAGREVARGRPDDWYVMDDTSSGMATQAKTLTIPVSGLEPGHRISLTVTRRELAPAERFRFREHVFADVVPVARHVLFVSGRTGAIAWSGDGAPPVRRVDGGLAWVVEGCPAWPAEPRQAGYERWLPVLCLAAPDTDWSDEGHRYLDLLAERLAPDPAAAREVERLTSPGQSRGERIAAIVRAVQRDYVYQAIEFGERARVPNPVSRIVADRYGDCKDHALLLKQLLEADGVPCHLALVNASGPVRPDLPSLDQFDHMIAYLPDLDGGRFVDCTDKSTDAMLPVPYLLANDRALVLDPAAPRLVTIGSYDPRKCLMHSEATLRLDEAGDVEVRQTLRFEGYTTAWLRAYLAALDPSGRVSAVQSQLALGGTEVRLHELRVENLSDAAAPLELNLRYNVRGAFQTLQDQIVGRLPAPWLQGMLREQTAGERRTPFELHMPVGYRGRVRLELPEGRRPGSLPALDREVRGRFFRWSLTARERDGAVEVDYAIDRVAGVFGPEDYGPFGHEGDACLDALRARLELAGPATVAGAGQ